MIDRYNGRGGVGRLNGHFSYDVDFTNFHLSVGIFVILTFCHFCKVEKMPKIEKMANPLTNRAQNSIKMKITITLK